MKLKAFVVCAALALCAAQSFAATHTEVTKAPRLPFMRGMGFFGFYGYGNDQYARKASVLETLKAKGFDHIRLPVDFRLYSTYDSGTGVATLLDRTYVRPAETWAPRFYAGFSDFDSIIDNAEAAGLYITLDFHGWFDINTTNQAQRAQFKAIWKAVAERYKDRSNKLIFELANEPGVNNGTTVNALNTLQKETVSIIRETNPTRLILYAVADANQPWALTRASNPPNYGWVSYPANDNNLALVVHSYNPGEFTHQGETWANPSYTSQVRLTDSHRSTLNWDLNQLTRFMKDHEIPLVMNEFNVSHKVADHGDITEYLSTITRYCEANGIPWSPWIYYNDGGGMDCFENTTEMYDFSEAGLFPDLKTTDKFSANDYPHAVDITFSGYSGSSALANFPVLVKLSESLTGFHYSDFTRADGFDLCFTDASGNLIPHEIDTWNPNGVSTIWVKVPSLTASTKIVARYGCAKPIVPKVESVWDSDYVGVWHMGEQKLPLADSSNVSRDLTAADGSGIGYGVAGVAGKSVDFGSAGGARGLFADDHANLDGHAKLTVEAWTYQKAHGTNAGIVSKRKSAGSQMSYYMFDNGSSTTMSYSTNGSASVSSDVYPKPVLGQWNHQAFSLDSTQPSSNSKGYLNGALTATKSVACPDGIFAGTGELCIGNLQSGNAANFPGRIDEVRVSKCVRSADWVKASYDTVANAAFATYAVDGVASSAAPEEQGTNLVPDDIIEYSVLDMDAFAKKVTVTFSGYSGTTLSDFPVLVKLSTAISGFSYDDFQKANGGDLRFADSTGNLLPHEIDTWNTNGVSTVWVKVPSLTKDTAITACYGCAEPPDVAAKDVWDDDYVGVWHLGESAVPMKESSETSSDFTQSNGNGIGFGADGIVGGSVDFGESGKSRALIAPDHDALDGFSQCTFEAWTFVTNRTSGSDVNKGLLSKRINYNNEASYYLHDTGSATKFYISANGTSSTDMSTNVKADENAWTHQVYTFDGGGSDNNVGAWKNGVDVGKTSKSVASVNAGSAPLYLGNFGPSDSSIDARNFPGKIDEVRISKVARSAAWIKATHDTIANANFATYAVQGATQPPAPSVASRTLPFRRGTNCRGLDANPYSTSTAESTYIYGLDSTYTDIKEKGFDYVRFSVDLTKYYDQTNDRLYTSDNYNIGIIDGFIRKFLNAGLYVHLLMGRVDGGSINLSDNDQKERFKRVWQLVAEHYQGWSDKLAFELCNEPGTPYGSLNNLEKQTVALIRQTNPTRLILWPVGDGSQPWVLTQAANPPKFDWVTLPEGDTNIAVVVHTYAPADFTHQGADWSYDANGNKRNYHVDLTDAYRAKLREDLTYLSQYAKAHPDVPIVLNEFGVMCGKSYESDAHEWLSTVREFCDANKIAWAHFEYTDFNNFKGMASRSHPTGDTWRTNVVDALFPKGWDDVPGTYGQVDLSAFSRKVTVSFTGYAGTTPLVDFPVLVKLSTAISGFSYADFQKANGGDLRFVDSHGNLIPHEIDTWNSSGVSTVWVKVPELTAATKIYACYGCANPPDVTAMDVWDDDYVGVWHLGESALPLSESTRRGPSFTQKCGEGVGFASSGVVGSSVAFGNSFSNGVIAVDHENLDGFEKLTVEVWTKQDSHKTNAGILSKRSGTNKAVSYYLYDTGTKTAFNASDNGTNSVVSSSLVSPAADGAWKHQAYSLDTTTASGNVNGYLNGALTGTASKAAGRVNADIAFLTLGNLQPGFKDYSFVGSIDEVRISKCVRSADWIKATHDTIANAAFATYAVDGIVPEEPPAPQVVSASDAAGFDYTNRLVTVTGLSAGETVTLVVARAGTTTAMTATADANGEAVFNVATAPGAVYSYAVSRDGTEVASGGFVTGGWKSGGSWFRGAFAAGAPVASGGSWTGAPQLTADGGTAAGDAQFALDAAARAAGSEKFARVEFNFKCEGMENENALSADHAPMFGGVSTVALSAGGTAWFAWDGAEWHRLYGDAPPEIGGTYIVRAELDFAASPKTVRYFVSSDGGGTFAPLFADAELADEWIACRAAPSDCVGEVAVEGALELASVAGALMGADVAEAEGAGYESLADALAAGGEVKLLTNATWPTNAPVGTVAVDQGGFALQGVVLDGSGNAVVSSGHSAIPGEGRINISLAQAAALGVATSGKTPAEIASALAADGANGIPLWKSYALGLDPSDPDAKPKAAIAVSGGKVELSLVGIDVNASSGATVTYRVYRFSDLADAEEEAVGGDRAASETAELEKSDRRMFYRLEINVKGY